MNVIGIDPGMSGAIAILDDGIWLFDMPTFDLGGKKKKRRRIDMAKVVDILHPYEQGVIAYIEKAQSMPGQGVASTFGYGITYGALLAILTCLKISYTEVHPRTWKKVMLSDVDKSSKDASRMRAKQLWPGNSGFDRKKDEHRAEAALIAEYGRRQLSAKPDVSNNNITRT